MQLDTPQLKQLYDALIDSFRSQAALARMVRFGLGANLATISDGSSLSNTVFDLIQWAEAQGKLDSLIQAALVTNPDNPRLRAFAASVRNPTTLPQTTGIHGIDAPTSPVSVVTPDAPHLTDIEVQLEGAQFDFADIEADRTQQFTGRQWVFQEIAEWLGSATASPFLLLGSPGTGKTSVAFRLIQFSEGRQPIPVDLAGLALGFLSASHICSTRISRTLDPRLVALSLARQLAKKLPAFRQFLIKVPFDLADLTVQQVWDNVLVASLVALKGQAVTILIDSLDEAGQYKGSPTLVELLENTGSIKGVHWLLTSRPEVSILTAFSTARQRDLIRDAPPSVDDVRDYARNRLRGTDLSLAEREVLAEKIAVPQQGNFLYARHVLDDIELLLKSGRKPDISKLPPSLDAVYIRFLKRIISNNQSQWNNQYRPLLGALATALGSGLPFPLLQEITEQIPSILNADLQNLRSYLSEYSADSPYRLYHQSFGEFLLSRTHNPLYWIDPAEAHGRTASRLINVSQENWAIASDYAKRYVPTHLIAAIRGGETQLQSMLRDILTHRLYLKTRLRVDGGSSSLLEQEYAYACELLPVAMREELKRIVVEVRKGDIEVSDSQIPQVEVPVSPQTPQVTDDAELRRMLRNVLILALPDTTSRVVFLRDAGLSDTWIGEYTWDGAPTTVAGQLIEVGSQQGTPLKIERPGYTVLGAVLTQLMRRQLVGLEDARYIAAALVNYKLIDFTVATIPPELGNLLTIK